MTAKRYFLDTNIIVYSFDAQNPDKQQRARQLIHDALTQNCGCISYQVVQEFCNVATRKFATPMSEQDCREYLAQVLMPLCEVYPGSEFYRQALVIQERWKYSFYDSLIINAANLAGCQILYSEDLQHGQQILGTSIQNPFA